MMTEKGLYIQMFSIHGLVRAENMELGYDADTGGQIKYVVELCKILSKTKQSFSLSYSYFKFEFLATSILTRIVYIIYLYKLYV